MRRNFPPKRKLTWKQNPEKLKLRCGTPHVDGKYQNITNPPRLSRKPLRTILIPTEQLWAASGSLWRAAAAPRDARLDLPRRRLAWNDRFSGAKKRGRQKALRHRCLPRHHCQAEVALGAVKKVKLSAVENLRAKVIYNKNQIRDSKSLYRVALCATYAGRISKMPKTSIKPATGPDASVRLHFKGHLLH